MRRILSIFAHPKSTPPVVFLHIPKTAGQSVHSELERVVGKAKVCPIRVHTQVEIGKPQMPAGYSLYSGHLDWHEITNLESPFVFTILRDPKERIASFYFYLKGKSEQASTKELTFPENTGLRIIKERSADDYFFGGDVPWQNFIKSHYDNFYVRYFSSQKVRFHGSLELESAEKNARLLSEIYSTEQLQKLDQDLGAHLGCSISVSKTYRNVSDLGSQSRWLKLINSFEKQSSLSELERFFEQDYILCRKLGFAFTP